MKTKFGIAKTELKTLFYSPVAWFLLVVFLIQCGVAYLKVLNQYATTQEIGGRSVEYMKDITMDIFMGRQGVFNTIMQNLYLYIPLLTMGLISRELASGTIKLLYSSPIRVRDIVLGKFIAMMIFNLLLIAVISIFTGATFFFVKDAEMGMLLSATLGFYMLICAYSAIGLFMSCLTVYQLVAALATFVMIGILTYIGTLWQQYDFIRDLTYFLSMKGRTEHMMTGLIVSKDVLYFLVIMFIFLGFSVLVLRFKIEHRSFMVRVGNYAGVLALGLLIGYIATLPALTGYMDFTSNKARTLTPNAQQIIKEFGDEPLEVTTYANLLDRYSFMGMPTQRNEDLARWEPYMRFKNNIRLKYVNYYDTAYDQPYFKMMYEGKSTKQVVEQIVKSNGLSMSAFLPPEQIRKMIDLKPELNRYVMLLKYKNKSTYLRVFNDNAVWPSETEVSAAFKRLLQDKMPKITFLSGELERSIMKLGKREYKGLTNYSVFRFSLVNQGFDVDTLVLDTQEVPASVSTLVMADPRTMFSDTAMARLQQYVDAGGNLLITCESDKRDLLNPFLAQFGVQLMEGTIIQPSKEEAPNLVQPFIQKYAAGFTKKLEQEYKDSTIVNMVGVTALSYADTGAFKVQPLLMTDGSASWLKKDKLVLDSAAVEYSAASGDIRKSFATAVALTRQVNGKEQRIVIAGDADFISNTEMQQQGTANFVFSTAIFSWLNNGTFPIDTSRPKTTDNRVKVSTDGVDRLRIFFVWVLPVLMIALAAILLIRRKRK